jgi:uncharacterized protein YybS (DUF2232 family)
LKIFGRAIPDNSFLKTLLIISFFVLAAAFIPAAGFILLAFLPLLIFVYSTFAGKDKTAIAFLIPVLLLFLFSHFFQINTPYPVIFIMGSVGLAIAAIALRNASVEKTIIIPALIIIISVCAYFFYAAWQLSLKPWYLVQQFVTQTIEQNINLYGQLPLDTEDINFIKNNKLMLISIFTNIFPAMAVIGSFIIVLFNVLIGKNILSRTAIILPKLTGLSGWKSPDFIIWIFLASGGLLLLPNEQIRFFSLNILILVCFIYLLQGLAIISFLFQNKNVPIFFRYLFYFLIAVQQLLMIPIIAAGLFDIWVDFRKLLQKNRASA